MFERVATLFRITQSHGIARRYFVVNGFDGALTMFGLIVGFYVTDNNDNSVLLSVCLGAAIALGMSGLSSAYISESAEKRKELLELEEAMMRDLSDTAYGQAARMLPLLIAVINGSAPLLIALIIVMPLWAEYLSLDLPMPAMEMAMLLAVVVIFLLGVFLGRVSGAHWFLAGARTLAIAAVTMLLIYLLSPR